MNYNSLIDRDTLYKFDDYFYKNIFPILTKLEKQRKLFLLAVCFLILLMPFCFIFGAFLLENNLEDFYLKWHLDVFNYILPLLFLFSFMSLFFVVVEVWLMCNIM